MKVNFKIPLTLVLILVGADSTKLIGDVSGLGTTAKETENDSTARKLTGSDESLSTLNTEYRFIGRKAVGYDAGETPADLLGNSKLPENEFDSTNDTLAFEEAGHITGVEKCLTQADFVHGTKIITEPGTYKLCENISFRPNLAIPGQPPAESSDPLPWQIDYFGNEYSLGFFAAIAIQASNVKLLLNNFTIEQSEEHALMQRFFAVIELASSPFIKSAGPAEFVGDDEFIAGRNIEILGPGTIGRSAHHGIHGNGNTQVKISGIQFKDFEVAAIALNNVDSLEISNCDIQKNRHDVPVVGMFSVARFLRPYARALVDAGYKMPLRGKQTSAKELYAALITSINNVFSDVTAKGAIDKNAHPEEYRLYHNPLSVIDGPCYAILIHGRGPAIGKQSEMFNETFQNVTSRNVTIKYNTIRNIECWSGEVPAAVIEDEFESQDISNVMKDARGAVLNFISTYNTEDPYLAINEDGTYKGNVVSDMQIMVAAAILDGTLEDDTYRQIAQNTITQAVVDWARNGTTVFTPKYRCNGDIMHHVIKGIIVIRLEDTAGFTITGNSIHDVNNLSVEPFSSCFDYHSGNSSENVGIQTGNVRAISVAAVRGYKNKKSVIKANAVFDINSATEFEVFGIDVQGDSEDIDIRNNFIDLRLDPWDGDDANEILCACRVREATSRVFVDSTNIFYQDIQMLNTNRIRSRRARKNLRPSEEIEWKAGGCPYANMID